VSGVDFDRVRALATMERVLDLLGFESSSRSGVQFKRGDRLLLLPSVPQSRQRAGTLGGPARELPLH
jgi:hypothetical protein